MRPNKLRRYNLLLYLIILLFVYSCKKEEMIKEIPGIYDFSISKDTLRQSIFNEDEYLLEFRFINEKGKADF